MATIALVLGLVVVASGGVYAVSAILFHDQTRMTVVPAGQIKTNLAFGESEPITIIGEVATSGYYINVTNPQENPGAAIYELQIQTWGVGQATGSLAVSLDRAAIQTVNSGYSTNYTITFEPSADCQGWFWVEWTLYQSTP